MLQRLRYAIQGLQRGWDFEKHIVNWTPYSPPEKSYRFQRLYPCSCGGAHYVQLSLDLDYVPQGWLNVSLHDNYYQGSLSQRLKRALSLVFRPRDEWTWGEVILDKETLSTLVEELSLAHTIFADYACTEDIEAARRTLDQMEGKL